MEPNPITILVPITLFLSVVFVICYAQYLNYRNRKRTLETIKYALEQSDEVDQGQIEAIARDNSHRFVDFRRGCIFMALAVAGFAFSFSLPDIEPQRVIRGISVFPAAMGFVYLLFHFISNRYEPSP